MHKKAVSLFVAVLAAIMMTAIPSGASDSARQTSDIVWFGDHSTSAGTSRLVRTPRGVVGTFHTSGLMPREALTMWWVVFNDPHGCSDACGEDDIFIDGDPANGLNLDGVAAADIVVGYAGGTVATQRGTATMTSHLFVGAPVVEVLFGTLPILKSSTAAEIHLVARSHGPAVPGTVAEQIGSYAGGCEVFLLPPAIPTEIGECADIQFAVHQP